MTPIGAVSSLLIHRGTLVHRNLRSIFDRRLACVREVTTSTSAAPRTRVSRAYQQNFFKEIAPDTFQVAVAFATGWLCVVHRNGPLNPSKNFKTHAAIEGVGGISVGRIAYQSSPFPLVNTRRNARLERLCICGAPEGWISPCNAKQTNASEGIWQFSDPPSASELTVGDLHDRDAHTGKCPATFPAAGTHRPPESARWYPSWMP